MKENFSYAIVGDSQMVAFSSFLAGLYFVLHSGNKLANSELVAFRVKTGLKWRISQQNYLLGAVAKGKVFPRMSIFKTVRLVNILYQFVVILLSAIECRAV